MNFLLNRRITICMLFIALSLLGYVSYKQLPVELRLMQSFRYCLSKCRRSRIWTLRMWSRK